MNEKHAERVYQSVNSNRFPTPVALPAGASPFWRLFEEACKGLPVRVVSIVAERE
jgi:hypothetical protein